MRWLSNLFTSNKIEESFEKKIVGELRDFISKAKNHQLGEEKARETLRVIFAKIDSSSHNSSNSQNDSVEASPNIEASPINRYAIKKK